MKPHENAVIILSLYTGMMLAWKLADTVARPVVRDVTANGRTYSIHRSLDHDVVFTNGLWVLAYERRSKTFYDKAKRNASVEQMRLAASDLGLTMLGSVFPH